MNDVDNKKSDSNADDLTGMSASAALGGARKIELIDSTQRRDWWHRILGIYGQYTFCAFLLMLPSDEEAVKYLKNYSRNLHIISGKKCLVIALTGREGFCTDFDEQLWATDVDEYVANGQSVSVSEHFKIPVANFPCLVIFRDIRKFDHVTVGLKNLSANDIDVTLREVFSSVSNAADKDYPLTWLVTTLRANTIFKALKVFVSDVKSFAENSFEIALKAYVEAITPHQS